MKKVLLLLLLALPSFTFSQEEKSSKVLAFPRYSLFHMYLEYGAGEFSNPFGSRTLEQVDVKMTYLENLPGAEWLSLGFVGQVSWNQPSAGAPAKGGWLPNSANLSMTMGLFQNILNLGISVKGEINPNIYYNKVLPTVKGLYSHDFTFLFSPTFSVLEGIRPGVTAFESLEMRVAYRMKLTKWLGFRPEFLFALDGGTLADGGTALEAFTFRFNPRVQFFANQFSFFIEPRFFYFGSPVYQGLVNADNGFAWELKVGFDITQFVLKNS